MPATFFLATIPWLVGPTSLPVGEPPFFTPVLPCAFSQPAVTSVEPACCNARVYFLRGSGYVFSPGFGKLCADLRQAGVSAEDMRSVGDRSFCRQLIADRGAGRPCGPIIIVGHSRGARHAIDAAAELEKAGIVVDLLVCVDVAGAAPVPGNVREALNVYMTQRRLYPAAALRPRWGSGTAIENLDLDAPGSGVDARALHHLNVTGSRSVQDLLLGRILEVARQP